MMPRENLLKPADGSPITLPNKEMAVGVFYLTSIDENFKDKKVKSSEEIETVYADSFEALLAHSFGKIKLREPVKVKIEGEIIETTVGRLMFNEHLPKSLGFINEPIKASGIKRIITRAMSVANSSEVEELIDRIKTLGFYGSTISGISVSVFDTALVEEKQTLIDEAENKITDIDEPRDLIEAETIMKKLGLLE